MAPPIFVYDFGAGRYTVSSASNSGFALYVIIATGIAIKIAGII